MAGTTVTNDLTPWYRYRRPSIPERRDKLLSWYATEEIDLNDTASVRSLPRGIPDALSFENIRYNRRKSPCTLKDFLGYLHYIEHNSENMQFYLWHDDYTERFNALPEAEQNLSPPWQPPSPGTAARAIQEQETDYVDPMAVTPVTPPSETDYHKVAEKAFESVGVKWQPYTVQPFRDEIAKIVATYIVPGAPRELNISARDRAMVTYALSQSTHPSTLTPLKRAVEDALLYQSHPCFIRWTMDNCNIERKIYGYTLCISMMIIGVAYSIVMTVSKYGRAWRLLGLILFTPGLLITLVGIRGICIILFCRLRRHQLRPWEMARAYSSTAIEKGISDLYPYTTDEDVVCDDNDNASSIFSNGGSSQYSEEYKKISFVRRIFAKDKKLEEPVLMECQNNLVKQGTFLTLVGSVVFAVLFVSLSSGQKF